MERLEEPFESRRPRRLSSFEQAKKSGRVRPALKFLFTEVKTRRAGLTSPFEGLREGQRRRLRRMALTWLGQQASRPYVAELRFDALGVTLDARDRLVAIEHLEGAF